MDFKELLSFEHKNMLELLDLLQQEQTFSVLMAAEKMCIRDSNAAVFTVITLFGFYLGAFVPGVSAYVSNSYEVGQTVAFLILAYSSILHVFNVRSANSVFRVKLSSNKSLFEMVVLALLITTTIALSLIHI